MLSNDRKELLGASGAEGALRVLFRAREIRPGVRIAMVSDPDGNWVEFLQIG